MSHCRRRLLIRNIALSRLNNGLEIGGAIVRNVSLAEILSVINLQLLFNQRILLLLKSSKDIYADMGLCVCHLMPAVCVVNSQNKRNWCRSNNKPALSGHHRPASSIQHPASGIQPLEIRRNQERTTSMGRYLSPWNQQATGRTTDAPWCMSHIALIYGLVSGLRSGGGMLPGNPHKCNTNAATAAGSKPTHSRTDARPGAGRIFHNSSPNCI